MSPLAFWGGGGKVSLKDKYKNHKQVDTLNIINMLVLLPF